MARYTDGANITAPDFTVSAAHLEAADLDVDAVLYGKSIKPADVTLPNEPLRALADAFACVRACRDGAIGEQSPLFQKMRSYEAEARRLAGDLTLAALGLDLGATAAAGGYALASAPFNRG